MNFIFKDFIPKHAASIDGVILSGNWSDLKSGKPEQLVKDLKETLKYLEEKHIKVVILGQNEIYNIPYPSIAAREYEYGKKISANYVVGKAYELNATLKRKFDPLYIDIYNYKDIPPLSNKYDPYMFDEHHLTKYGADIVVEKLYNNKSFINFLK